VLFCLNDGNRLNAAGFSVGEMGKSWKDKIARSDAEIARIEATEEDCRNGTVSVICAAKIVSILVNPVFPHDEKPITRWEN
jgi:hypothetical protein